MSENKLHFETLQLHVGQEEADPATGARAVPIYQTTSYVFNNSAHAAARFGLTDAGNIYGRLTNPTEDVLEKRIAALEGGVAGLAVASGAAAISYTIQALAQNGGHVVAQKTIYGGSYNLLEHTLPNFGITATFVDAHNLKEIEDAIQPPWQCAAGGPGRQCGAAGAVFAAGRPARYRGAGRCGPAPCGCPAAGSNAAARCCAAGAGRGRACCARLPAAVGRLDGGVGGFLLGAAAGPVGQARYRKLPPEPLPPL